MSVNLDELDFSAEALLELSTYLLQCEAMREPRKRKQVLNLVSEDVFSHSYQDGELDILVLEIVQTCEKRLWLGKLLEAIYKFEGDTKAWYKLHQHVSNLRNPPIVGREHLKELFELTEKFSWSQSILEEAYKIAVPSLPEWPLPYLPMYNPAEYLHQMLGILSQAPRQLDGTLPILKFIAFLAIKSPEADKNRLQAWVETVATARGELPQIYRMPQDLDKKTLSPPCLLVQITESSLPEQFLVEARLFNSQANPQPPLSRIDTPIPLEKVKEWLNDLLVVRLPRILSIARKCIFLEIFLPRKLMCQEIEKKWQIEMDEDTSWSLEGEYNVILRAAERIDQKNRFQPSYLNELKNKWEELEQYNTPGYSTDVTPIHIHTSQCCSKDDFLKELNKRGVIGLAVPELLPSYPCDAPQWDPLAKSYIRGIPVALWLRKDGVNLTSAVHTWFNSLLEYNKLSSLREEVFKLRRDNPALGDYLSFLWDDPNRLPPLNDEPLELAG
jgi:hypothetical protein